MYSGLNVDHYWTRVGVPEIPNVAIVQFLQLSIRLVFIAIKTEIKGKTHSHRTVVVVRGRIGPRVALPFP